MASCTVHQKKDFKGEVLLGQIVLRLGNKAMEVPFGGQGFCYPGLKVMHLVHGSRALFLLFDARDFLAS